MSVKPKHFSEIYQDASSLAKGITKVSNHELLACGKCNEPIRTLREQETSTRISGYVVKFCTKCGSEIDWSEVRIDWDEDRKKIKYCDECSLSFNDEESFCVHCGQPLEVHERKDREF